MKTEDIVIIGAIAAGAFFLLHGLAAAAQGAQRPAVTTPKKAVSGDAVSQWLAVGLNAIKQAGMLATGGGGSAPAGVVEDGPRLTQYDGVSVGNSWQDIATYTIGTDASNGASMSVPLQTYQLPQV